jgi:hypothetical protein
MFKILRTTLFLFGILCAVDSIVPAQEINGSKGWKIVDFCGMSFSVPESLQNEKVQGIDSCVATLTDKRTILTLDYGWYSGVSKYAHFLEFDEKPIEIGKKKGTIATYRDPRMAPEHSWVSRIFVVVTPSINGSPEVAMNMFVVVGDKTDFQIAEVIFRSIKFKR